MESIAYDGNTLINSYEYDAVSNRVSKNTSIEGDIEKIADVSSGVASSVVKGKTTYTYNELNQLINEQTSMDVRVYQYDENGNLISEKSSRAGQRQSELQYNEYNQLIVSTQQIGNEVTITRYEYDAEGNRIASQTNEQDKICYVNETTGLANVLAETDEKGKEKAFYTYDYEGAVLL